METCDQHVSEFFPPGPNTSGGKVDGPSTRVMIFSSYRHSVQEIAEMLSKHQPLVKVMTFVGHASGKNTKGFTQKEQLEVTWICESESFRRKLYSYAFNC